MRIRWYGQSAFLLTAERSVFIDPFGLPGAQLAARGLEFRYPPIEDVTADLVLVAHEHFDHNGVDVIGGEPAVLRSTAGRLESPVGEVVAVAAFLDAFGARVERVGQEIETGELLDGEPVVALMSVTG